jgi:hypothetical protein
MSTLVLKSRGGIRDFEARARDGRRWGKSPAIARTAVGHKCLCDVQTTWQTMTEPILCDHDTYRIYFLKLTRSSQTGSCAGKFVQVSLYR